MKLGQLGTRHSDTFNQYPRHFCTIVIAHLYRPARRRAPVPFLHPLHHLQVWRRLQAEVYFAHPYSAWERATNENTNGLIRQYFPKSLDFADIKKKDIEIAMHRLNNRPRKCLGFNTPNQVFFILLLHLMVESRMDYPQQKRYEHRCPGNNNPDLQDLSAWTA